MDNVAIKTDFTCCKDHLMILLVLLELHRRHNIQSGQSVDNCPHVVLFPQHSPAHCMPKFNDIAKRYVEMEKQSEMMMEFKR